MCVSLPLAHPLAPTITTVSFTAGAAFTVGWSETPGSCEILDSFHPQISPSDLSCMMSGMIYTCSYSETHLGQVYTFTVSALNCGTQRADVNHTEIVLQGMYIPVHAYYCQYIKILSMCE